MTRIFCLVQMELNMHNTIYRSAEATYFLLCTKAELDTGFKNPMQDFQLDVLSSLSTYMDYILDWDSNTLLLIIAFSERGVGM